MVFVAVVVVVVVAAIVTYIVSNYIQTTSYYFVNVIPSIIGIVVISIVIYNNISGSREKLSSYESSFRNS
jgi:hypothetical protein